MLIDSYTRESGVRNLERQIANVCRKVAKDILVKKFKSIKLSPAKIQDYLGPILFHSEIAERTKSQELLSVLLGQHMEAIFYLLNHQKCLVKEI